MRILSVTALILSVLGLPAMGSEFVYKERLLKQLVDKVPGLLETFDEETGHFGTGIWICRDQDRVFPLAVAYASPSAKNPYHKDPKLLEIIMKAGEALIEDTDDEGRWEFRKKDGSTWGPIHMPWTYSRWIRAYALIAEDMPAPRRKAWVEALTLGYGRILEQQLHNVHNIPAHHAMGLYIAGKALERPEWSERAVAFLLKVAGEQSEGGYWSENRGPVVGYNFVYLDALGTYFALSGDTRVLPVLEKGARFHRYFSYPNGHQVETIDERNPYHRRVSPGVVGLTFTQDGRTYLKAQWDLYGWEKLTPDLIASLLMYGKEGDTAESESSAGTFVLSEGGVGRAAVIEDGPWFVCLSAYTAPLPKSRWIQDRQNLVSVYHDKTGLILGGGNTKLQPAWSNFTVGDGALLQHTPGDTDPDFEPKGQLYHIPKEASLTKMHGGEPAGLDLVYGPETCRIRVVPIDGRTLEYRIEATVTSPLPVVAHITLVPLLELPIETASGAAKLTDERIELSSEDVGGWVKHGEYRLDLPETATLHWPALRHNPYRKDGHSTIEEARVEIRIPMTAAKTEQTVTIRISE